MAAALLYGFQGKRRSLEGKGIAALASAGGNAFYQCLVFPCNRRCQLAIKPWRARPRRIAGSKKAVAAFSDRYFYFATLAKRIAGLEADNGVDVLGRAQGYHQQHVIAPYFLFGGGVAAFGGRRHHKAGGFCFLPHPVGFPTAERAKAFRRSGGRNSAGREGKER